MNTGSATLRNVVEKRLHEFGITLEVDTDVPETVNSSATTDANSNAVVTLTAQGHHARYTLTVTAAMTLTSILSIPSTPYPLLVVGPRITGRSAAALREANIQYVDAIGNAYIKFEGVLVEVRGRMPSTLDSSPDRRTATKVHPHYQEITPPPITKNLFSPRRSQVVMALLAWPHLSGAKVRDIATAAGVSIGQAHDALSLLEDAGYLRGTPPRLHRFSDLLDYWANQYPRGLGRKLTLATFYSDSLDDVHPPHPDQAIYFSGESARGVDVLRRTTLTIYVDTFDTRIALVNRWQAGRDRKPNVTVMQKFWTDPENSVPVHRRHEKDPIEPHNAPWPLVYADLLASADPRLAEVAQTWRNDRSVESGQM